MTFLLTWAATVTLSVGFWAAVIVSVARLIK
jgi:hypothetical protein